MASTTTINSWVDQLFGTITTSSISTNKQWKRKQLEIFRRRIRHHNYGRTNQFDVEQRLNGLEEKFQILNRDDLSDAVHERRTELNEYGERWLPDALDLLLRLSNDPVRKTKPSALYENEPNRSEPLPLKWADAEAADIFDQSDAIWATPAWSDLSSAEDELEESSATTSPERIKRQSKTDQIRIAQSTGIYEDQTLESDVAHDTSSVLDRLASAHFEHTNTELYIIRELVLLLQGFPTSAFIMNKEGDIQLHTTLSLPRVSREVTARSLHRIVVLHKQLNVLREFAKKEASSDFLQTIQEDIDRHLNGYMSFLDNFVRSMLNVKESRVNTLLGTIDLVEEQAIALRLLAMYSQAASRSDAVGCLDLMFEHLSRHFYCVNEIGVATFMPIFLRAFRLYLQPLEDWLNNGTVTALGNPFFIQPLSGERSPSSLWHHWFGWDLEGVRRPSKLLTQFVEPIFTCGKTSAFLKLIEGSVTSHKSSTFSSEDLLVKIQEAADNFAIPLPAAIPTILVHAINAALESKTVALKQLLDNKCGLTLALNAFDYIYLRKNGMLTDHFESKIFRRIDRCHESWNDRFLVADMLEDAFGDVLGAGLSAVAVHSIRTSSRSMDSRRRSVRIMSALAIEYVLPWPIANIISTTSMNAYRQISLQFAQVRRAKYVLERIAFSSLHTSAIFEDASEQKHAQLMAFMLINFTNTLYDHFTSTTEPHTTQMRSDLHTAAKTVDQMISIHKSYMSKIQHICLVSKPLKVLRDSLTGLLDMCIRFADLVSMTKQSHEKPTDDFETSSFMSAQSQTWRKRRHRRKQQRNQRRKLRYPQDDDDILPSSSSSDADGDSIDEESSEDDEKDDHDRSISEAEAEAEGEGEGEGYSSFIVLDQDTTVGMEIKKLQTQFRRQLDFLIAGLRAAGRGGESAGWTGADEMGLLADRLSWK